MPIAGIITEYNPLHRGHIHLLEETRRLLGEDCAVICAMSGDLVQRGDFAIAGKRARAAAAVRSGADLVLELPLPWAVSSAEGFAWGGVGVLAATGLVDTLVFGCEGGDAGPLLRVASALLTPEFSSLLQGELRRGDSFAAARQRAAEALTSPEDAALLKAPNSILAVEYCKSLLTLGSAIQPLAVLRTGPGHDAPDPDAAFPSAASLRELLRAGKTEAALARMAPAMAQVFREEAAAGRAPVLLEHCERAILARLRTMGREDFAALDPGREGLGYRLYRASREATSLEEVLALAKTKRYAHARLRRMILWAFLGLTPAGMPQAPLYLRPLAANKTGRDLLARMRKTAALPVMTRPAQLRKLPEAQRLFDLEARAADLSGLACPVPAPGGREWKAGPVLL